jgi:hypothetical protein
MRKGLGDWRDRDRCHRKTALRKTQLHNRHGPVQLSLSRYDVHQGDDLPRRCGCPQLGRRRRRGPPRLYAIDLNKTNGDSLRVRRIMKHTVVGEMGFIRHSLRSATVSTDGPATLFTVTRGNFERLRRERPDLANAFDDFIMRMLADRVDVANREMVALSNLRR